MSNRDAPLHTVILHRVLRAPPGKVYRAFLDADALARWLPPYGFLCQVHHLEAKVGGTFKMSFVNFSSGNSHSFSGEYLEVEPPSRLVNTELFDVPPFNEGEPAIVTQVLEEVDGRTKLTSTSRFPSAEALEGALATGMVGGAIESWDRLEEEARRG